jgi:glycine dehydrogenase subunit 1
MQYLPLTPEDIKEMLSSIGVGSVDELKRVIHESVILNRELNLPSELSELGLRDHFDSLVNQNYNTSEIECFAGGTAFDHYVPSAVDHLSSLPELLTAYTPYQPELSQGTLTAIFEWQTALCNLTGHDVANASLYDGATSVCESARVACTQMRSNSIAISELVNPAYIDTLKSFARNIGFSVSIISADGDRTSKEALEKLANENACVIVQSPNCLGTIEDIEALNGVKGKSIFIQVIAEAVSLGLLKRPGDMGVDICCGEAQSFGISLNFGGPYLGFVSSAKKFMRKLPGRIVGESVDRHGNRSLTLTLRPREQDIRREKATSNICTNNGNTMLRAIIYLALMGKMGLREVARQSCDKAHYLAETLRNKGVKVINEHPFFNEFAIELDNPPANLQELMLDRGYLIIKPDKIGHLIISATEKNTKPGIEGFVKTLQELIS